MSAFDRVAAIRDIANAPTSPPMWWWSPRSLREEGDGAALEARRKQWPKQHHLRAIALLLVAWADDEGHYAASITRVADRSGIHKIEVVDRILDALELLGWVTVQRHEGAPEKGQHVYRCELGRDAGVTEAPAP